MGTGKKPSMIGGIRPRTTMMAAKRAMSTRERVCMKMPSVWLAVFGANASRVDGIGNIVGALQRADDHRDEQACRAYLEAAGAMRLDDGAIARLYLGHETDDEADGEPDIGGIAEAEPLERPGKRGDGLDELADRRRGGDGGGKKAQRAEAECHHKA